MQVVKVISTSLDSLSRRIVKVLRRGKDDVQTAKEYAPFGDDSNAPADYIALFTETGIKGKTAIVGYLNKNLIAGVGEKRIFSLRDDGTISIDIILKNDGTMEIGGDTDFMVRFSELKTGFDQLKTDFNALVTTFNAHVHPGVTVGAGATLVTTTLGSSSSASIDDSKIDEVKTI